MPTQMKSLLTQHHFMDGSVPIRNTVSMICSSCGAPQLFFGTSFSIIVSSVSAILYRMLLSSNGAQNLRCSHHRLCACGKLCGIPFDLQRAQNYQIPDPKQFFENPELQEEVLTCSQFQQSKLFLVWQGEGRITSQQYASFLNCVFSRESKIAIHGRFREAQDKSIVFLLPGLFDLASSKSCTKSRLIFRRKQILRLRFCMCLNPTVDNFHAKKPPLRNR